MVRRSRRLNTPSWLRSFQNISKSDLIATSENESDARSKGAVFCLILSLFPFPKLAITIGSSKLREMCGNTIQHVAIIHRVHFGHFRQSVQLTIAIFKLRKTEKWEESDKKMASCRRSLQRIWCLYPLRTQRPPVRGSRTKHGLHNRVVVALLLSVLRFIVVSQRRPTTMVVYWTMIILSRMSYEICVPSAALIVLPALVIPSSFMLPESTLKTSVFSHHTEIK